MLNTTTVIATPNPSAAALTGAASLSVVLGYGASLLATKWGIPSDVTLAVLTGAATVATSWWHRFFGPAVPVQKSI